MFTDERRATVWERQCQHGLRGFSKWLTPQIVAQAAQSAGVPLGRGALNLGVLVWLGLVGCWKKGESFANVLVVTLKLLRDASDDDWLPKAAKPKKGRKGKRHAQQPRSKHDPRRADPTQISEEAFVKARQRMPWRFWIALTTLLADRFVQEQPQAVRWKHFRLLALDGTTINLPRWAALAKEFGTANNQCRGPRTPQARLTMLQFPLCRIPYRYAVSPLAQGEKTVAADLLGHLRPNDLLLMDRGFWSYGLFWQIQRCQAFFALRLPAQVKLRTIRRLGPKDRLVRYAPTTRRTKWPHLPEALDLRVIDYQIPGFRPSAIVTNVLQPRTISRADWVRLAVTREAGRNLAPGLYHRRWEIETTFRELKVEQGMEGSLRGRTPGAIRFEIAAHVLLYLLVRWLIVEAANKHGVDDPLRLSFLEALRELHNMTPILITASSQRVRTVLLPRLLDRIAAHRVPHRPGRHYARPNDTKRKNKGNGRFQRPSKIRGAKG